jgi:hypothetical protein
VARRIRDHPWGVRDIRASRCATPASALAVERGAIALWIPLTPLRPPVVTRCATAMSNPVTMAEVRAAEAGTCSGSRGRPKRLDMLLGAGDGVGDRRHGGR